MVEPKEETKEGKAHPIAKGKPGPQVGDKVLYLPHVNHALHLHHGDLGWVIGRKHSTPTRNGMVEEVEELWGDRLTEFLGALKRSPNSSQERANMVFIRPNKPWPAVITAVNDDGTVNVDIDAGNGFTLHETVKLHKEGPPHTPHTCFLVKKDTEEKGGK